MHFHGSSNVCFMDRLFLIMSFESPNITITITININPMDTCDKWLECQHI